MIYLPLCDNFYVSQEVPVGTTIQVFDCQPHLPSLEKTFPWVQWPDSAPLRPLIPQERWWFPEYTSFSYASSWSHGTTTYIKTPCIPAVPEPSTWALLLSGLVLFLFLTKPARQ